MNVKEKNGYHMLKKVIISIAALLILITAIQVQAGGISLGNGLDGSKNPNQEEPLMKKEIDKEFKPYDDLKITKGVTAGYFSGLDGNIPKVKDTVPFEEKKKGMGVGMGLSLSF